MTTDSQAVSTTSRQSRKARRRENLTRKFARDAGTDSTPTGFVDLICDSCEQPILVQAHPGDSWPVVKMVAPLVLCGDEYLRDRVRTGVIADIIARHGQAGKVAQHGICSSFVGGLWVRGWSSVLDGRWPIGEGRWTNPQPAGVNGDADDHCVIGQPTIITHRAMCRPIRVDLFDLVMHVEAAISAGRGKIFVKCGRE